MVVAEPTKEVAQTAEEPVAEVSEPVAAAVEPAVAEVLTKQPEIQVETIVADFDNKENSNQLADWKKTHDILTGKESAINLFGMRNVLSNEKYQKNMTISKVKDFANAILRAFRLIEKNGKDEVTVAPGTVATPEIPDDTRE